jgi:hypothetical protein
MPTYILLSTLTSAGRRTLHSDPDRLDEVNQEITDFGREVVAQHAVLGFYDSYKPPTTRPLLIYRSTSVHAAPSKSSPRRRFRCSCARN